MGIYKRGLKTKGRHYNIEMIQFRDDAKYCYYCNVLLSNKGSKRRTIDHVVPLKQGGVNSLNNIVISCSKCNAIKGGYLILDLIAQINSRIRFSDDGAEIQRLNNIISNFERGYVKWKETNQHMTN